MSGGPRRARARRAAGTTASTRRTASRSRRPATASRCSRSSSRSSTGMWTTPAGEPFTFDGQALHDRRLPRAAEARAATAAADHHRRLGHRSARRASPRSTPTSSTCRSRPSSYYRDGCDIVRAACEQTGRDPATMRFTVARRRVRRRATRPSSSGAPTAIGHEPDDLRANAARRTRRRSRRAHPARSPRPAPRPSTSRCSTSTTSITCA